ncbi:MAG: hypothetical protein IPJ56_15780 [Gemmatimonadetes bacterium]|nr:hypothetical protein [Gemmatimonadota bacterium]
MASARGTASTSTVLAIKAGADILLKPSDPTGAIDAIVAAVERGELSRERIDASVRRVLELKARAGVAFNRFVSLDSLRRIVGAPAHRAAAHDIARRAVTLLRDRGALVPSAGKRTLLIQYMPETELRAGRAFAASLRSGNPSLRVVKLSPSTAASQLDALAPAIAGAERVVLAAYVRRIEGEGRPAIPAHIAEWMAGVARPTPPRQGNGWSSWPSGIRTCCGSFRRWGATWSPMAWETRWSAPLPTRLAGARASPGRPPCRSRGSFPGGTGFSVRQAAARPAPPGAGRTASASLHPSVWGSPGRSLRRRRCHALFRGVVVAASRMDRSPAAGRPRPRIDTVRPRGLFTDLRIPPAVFEPRCTAVRSRRGVQGILTSTRWHGRRPAPLRGQDSGRCGTC